MLLNSFLPHRPLTCLSAIIATWRQHRVYTSTSWTAQTATRCTKSLSSGRAWWSPLVLKTNCFYRLNVYFFSLFCFLLFCNFLWMLFSPRLPIQLYSSRDLELYREVRLQAVRHVVQTTQPGPRQEASHCCFCLRRSTGLISPIVVAMYT